MQQAAPSIYVIKCVTRLLPHHCDDTEPGSWSTYDRLLEYTTTSVDLGTYFWRRKLDSTRIARLLQKEAQGQCESALLLERQLDEVALREMSLAKAIFASTKNRMPGPHELWFAYRVLSRAIGIGTRHENGFQLHMARGIVTDEYQQYVLEDVIAAAEFPERYAFGREVCEILTPELTGRHVDVVIINIRNDGELNQAFIVASLCKRLLGKHVPVVLDTSDANEQFDFGSWLPILAANRSAASSFLDFFLPRQDYKSTLRYLIKELSSGRSPTDAEPNLVPFGNVAESAPDGFFRIGGGQRPVLTSTEIGKIRPTLDDAFEHYVSTIKVFKAAGRRTIAIRLSPNRCHWAACSFCTINSQHMLPRACY